MIKEMELFKRENGTWYIRFSRIKKISLKTKNKLEAQRKYNALIADMGKGKVHQLHSSISFSEFRVEYERYIKKCETASYATSIKYSFDHFQDFLGDKELAKLTKRDMARFVEHMLTIKTSEKSKGRGKGYSKSSINIDIRNIKAAMSTACEWEYIQQNPFEKYKQLTIDKKAQTFLKQKDISVVSENIDNDIIKRAFFFYILTGCRREEVVTLTWRNIDFENNVIYIEKTKNHLAKTIPINKYLRELLDEIPLESRVGYLFPSPRKRGAHLHKDTMSHVVKKYLTQSGQGHLHLHDLRHTFATLLAMQGVTLKDLATLLGHTDTRTILYPSSAGTYC
jgi:integrase